MQHCGQYESMVNLMGEVIGGVGVVWCDGCEYRTGTGMDTRWSTNKKEQVTRGGMRRGRGHHGRKGVKSQPEDGESEAQRPGLGVLFRESGCRILVR